MWYDSGIKTSKGITLNYDIEQLLRIDPKRIAYTCSNVHVCNVLSDVISDLIKMHTAYNALSKEVLSLNPNCNEIGSGKILNMQELAKIK